MLCSAGVKIKWCDMPRNAAAEEQVIRAGFQPAPLAEASAEGLHARIPYLATGPRGADDAPVRARVACPRRACLEIVQRGRHRDLVQADILHLKRRR